jgi:hypothetical protein
MLPLVGTLGFAHPTYLVLAVVVVFRAAGGHASLCPRYVFGSVGTPTGSPAVTKPDATRYAAVKSVVVEESLQNRIPNVTGMERIEFDSITPSSV